LAVEVDPSTLVSIPGCRRNAFGFCCRRRQTWRLGCSPSGELAALHLVANLSMFFFRCSLNPCVGKCSYVVCTSWCLRPDSMDPSFIETNIVGLTLSPTISFSLETPLSGFLFWATGPDRSLSWQRC
jgi:hypothetical protein